MKTMLELAVTKTGKTIRCKGILDGGVVGLVDSAWLMSEVFPNHPRWLEKRGTGVRRVEIRKMPPFNSNCFFLYRTDGSAVDISYRESIRPSTQTAKVRAAARCEIERDVHCWKLKTPAPEAGMHADHIEPFDGIWRAFLEKNNIVEGDISIISDEIGRGDYFENRRMSHAWQRFHYDQAKFQWLSAKENILKSNSNAA